MSFLRFAQPAILATLGVIVFFVIASIVINAVLKKTGDEDLKKTVPYVNWSTKLIIGILVAALAWQLIAAALVNEVDRSAVDRNHLNWDRYQATPTSTFK